MLPPPKTVGTRATGRIASVLLAASACLAGCHSSPRHFTLHGQVIRKDAAATQLTINHGEIPGFMAAMAMPYNVKDAQGFGSAEPGDQISADVAVPKPNEYWLDHVVVTDSSARGKAFVDPSAVPVQFGAPVPDVPLVNQDGKTLSLRQFKGQAILLTFIYTRCPLPNFCPLISSQFSEVRKDLAGLPASSRTHLVSVTLDPDFDRPPVLRQYGLEYLNRNPAGFAQWDFVAASPAGLRTLADAFGLKYSTQDGQIVHGMQTVLIAPDGTVARSWPGNDWRPQQVITAIQQSLDGKS